MEHTYLWLLLGMDANGGTTLRQGQHAGIQGQHARANWSTVVAWNEYHLTHISQTGSACLESGTR